MTDLPTLTPYGFPAMRLLRVAAAAIAVAAALFPIPAAAKEKPEEEEEAAPEVVAFDLGAYSVKESRPVEGIKTKLSFTLHASTTSDRAEAFEKLYENGAMRVRDQVIISARLTEPAEFQDPKLDRFRRRVLIRIRRALPTLPIDDVYFSEFHYTVE